MPYNRPFSAGIMWHAASSVRHRRNPLTPACNACEAAPRPLLRVPNRFSGIRDFPYLKLGIRDLKAKSGRDSALKVRAGGGIPKITLWDYRITRNFGSGLRDWRTLLGTLLVLGPLRTQQINGSSLRISFQSDWQIDSGFFNRPITMRIQILVHRWGPRTRKV